VIDEAAEQAGRPPGAVRRLLNIGPGMAAEELAELALTEGISGFIMAGDDPSALRRFGSEVAPAVRELVTAERSR
jgi:hypothetical protein